MLRRVAGRLRATPPQTYPTNPGRPLGAASACPEATPRARPCPTSARGRSPEEPGRSIRSQRMTGRSVARLAYLPKAFFHPARRLRHGGMSNRNRDPLDRHCPVNRWQAFKPPGWGRGGCLASRPGTRSRPEACSAPRSCGARKATAAGRGKGEKTQVREKERAEGRRPTATEGVRGLAAPGGVRGRAPRLTRELDIDSR